MCIKGVFYLQKTMHSQISFVWAKTRADKADMRSYVRVEATLAQMELGRLHFSGTSDAFRKSAH